MAGSKQLAALLTLISCLSFSMAGNVPDVAEFAVEALSQLGSAALHLQLSSDELSKWNASLSDQQLMCVEDAVKERFIQRAKSIVECESALKQLFEADGTGIVDVGSGAFQSGSGLNPYDDHDAALPHGILSTLLCDQACGNVLSSYDECKIFADAVGEKVKRVLQGLCRRNEKGKYCLDVLERYTLPKASPNCSIGSCPMSCKLELAQGLEEFGCCLDFAALIVETESILLPELMSKCELPKVPKCKNEVEEDQAIESEVEKDQDKESDAYVAATSSRIIPYSVVTVCIISVIFGTC